jgi:hypothetical protein
MQDYISAIAVVALLWLVVKLAFGESCLLEAYRNGPFVLLSC